MVDAEGRDGETRIVLKRRTLWRSIAEKRGEVALDRDEKHTDVALPLTR